LGYNAGYSGTNLITGSNNIIIGNDIAPTSTTMTRGLNIGNLIFGTGLDGSGTTLSTGNVGVGSTTPWRKFGVTGTVGLSGTLTAGTTGNYMCLNTTTWEVQKGGATCSASSIRFKENVRGLSYGLSDIERLNPVFFNYKPETGQGTSTRIGFIAEEVNTIMPELVTLDKDGIPESLDYAKLTAVLTKALQETVSILDIRNAATSSQTLLSYYSATGTPAIFVDAKGNVGIGTTTPNYKLTVDGEVAAKGFINISTKSAKKDIVYITATQEEEILNKIKEANLATYNYNGESCGDNSEILNPNSQTNLKSEILNPKSCRLGLIAEEAPSEVLSIDGKGVDLYKMTSFAWLGLKAQESKIDKMELRLADLEAKLANLGTRFPNEWQYTAGATSTNTLPEVWSANGSLLAAVVGVLQNAGITLADGFIQTREFLADKITAKKLCLEDVCVTRDELKALLDKNQITPAESIYIGRSYVEATSTSPTVAVEIIVNGNNPAILQMGDVYGDLGAYASTTDASIVALGVRAFQNGAEVATPAIDTSVAGTFTIVYKIVDGGGSVLATATRTVIVEQPLVTVPETATTTDALPTDTASSTAPII
jgi:hypothetical protein